MKPSRNTFQIVKMLIAGVVCLNSIVMALLCGLLSLHSEYPVALGWLAGVALLMAYRSVQLIHKANASLSDPFAAAEPCWKGGR